MNAAPGGATTATNHTTTNTTVDDIGNMFVKYIDSLNENNQAEINQILNIVNDDICGFGFRTCTFWKRCQELKHDNRINTSITLLHKNLKSYVQANSRVIRGETTDKLWQYIKTRKAFAAFATYDLLVPSRELVCLVISKAIVIAKSLPEFRSRFTCEYDSGIEDVSHLDQNDPSSIIDLVKSAVAKSHHKKQPYTTTKHFASHASHPSHPWNISPNLPKNNNHNHTSPHHPATTAPSISDITLKQPTLKQQQAAEQKKMESAISKDYVKASASVPLATRLRQFFDVSTPKPTCHDQVEELIKQRFGNITILKLCDTLNLNPNQVLRVKTKDGSPHNAIRWSGMYETIMVCW